MAVKKTVSSIRTDIDTLFADNASGDISASDVRAFLNTLVDNLLFEGGGLRIGSPRPAQTIAITNTKIINFETEIPVGDAVIPDVTNNKLTITYDGFYTISANLSIEFGANKVINFAPSINGVLSPIKSTVTGEGSTKPKQVVLPMGELLLSAGDVIELYANADSSGTLVIRSGFIQLIHRPLGT